MAPVRGRGGWRSPGRFAALPYAAPAPVRRKPLARTTIGASPWRRVADERPPCRRRRISPTPSTSTDRRGDERLSDACCGGSAWWSTSSSTGTTFRPTRPTCGSRRGFRQLPTRVASHRPRTPRLATTTGALPPASRRRPVPGRRDARRGRACSTSTASPSGLRRAAGRCGRGSAEAHELRPLARDPPHVAQSDPAHSSDDVIARKSAPARRHCALQGSCWCGRTAPRRSRPGRTRTSCRAAGAAARGAGGRTLGRGPAARTSASTSGTRPPALWRSLCRRLAEYRLGQGAILVTPKAGEEEATVAAGRHPLPRPDLHRQPPVAARGRRRLDRLEPRAPPPGRGVGDDIDSGPDGKPRFTDGAEPSRGLTCRSRFQAVPGSLPRLRYGRRYALRARAVDLAGNSLPPAEGDFGPEALPPPPGRSCATSRSPAPVLALVRPQGGATPPLGEGESMHRMAIRSFNDVFDDPDRVRGDRAPSCPAAADDGTRGRAARDARPGRRGRREHVRHAGDREGSRRERPGAAVVEELIPRQGPLDLEAWTRASPSGATGGR